MTELITEIKTALVKYGAILENWKIKIVEVNGDKDSDYKTVVVECFKPRYKKPFIVWELYIDIVRGLLFWEKSNFCYL